MTNGVPAPPGVLKRLTTEPSFNESEMTSLPWSIQAYEPEMKGFMKMEFLPWNFQSGVPEVE